MRRPVFEENIKNIRKNHGKKAKLCAPTFILGTRYPFVFKVVNRTA